MKRLFLYYSLTGNCEAVAARYAGAGWDVCRVESAERLPKRFFFRVLQGGFLAGIGHKSKLLPLEKDPAEYDEIVVCSPIWNARLCCPISSLLDDERLRGRKISFVFCSGSGEGPKAAQKIAKLFPAAAVSFLKEPREHPAELDKLVF